MISWQPGITIDQLEKEVIIKALQFYGNNKTQTSIALGISTRTLDNKLEKYREEENDFQRRAVEISRDQQARILAHQGKGTGVHGESAFEARPQQQVPVQQREKIQEVSPTRPAGTGTNRR